MASTISVLANLLPSPQVMRYTVDTETQTLSLEGRDISLYSEEAFEILSHQWLKTGWQLRYHYTFSWMGRPVLQLPEDLVRLQEVIFTQKPTVIIETGIALGGSLLFYASLCKALDNGRVIGVDVDLRPPNRKALEEHVLAPHIHLIDGDSSKVETVEKVKNLLDPDDRVMVILDSNHSRDHVLAELRGFAPLVSPGFYLVVTDGLKRELVDTPRGKEYWEWDHPLAAVEVFLEENPHFERFPPQRVSNRSSVSHNVSHLLEGWLRKTMD